eukprot:8705171-Alexandrium_andersonii.AAC.1
MATVPLHEAVQEEFVEDPALEQKVQRAIESKSLPPCFYDHPVVKRRPGLPTLPVALFMDGVGYANRDAVWG